MVTLGARPQGLEHHRDYLSIGFPLRLRHRLSIHVHRGLDGGVTHEFLLYLHRRSGFVQPRTIRVAEGVPADVGELACCCLAQLVNDNPLAVRSGLALHAPFARRHAACRTWNDAASGSAKIALLDLGRIVGFLPRLTALIAWLKESRSDVNSPAKSGMSARRTPFSQRKAIVGSVNTLPIEASALKAAHALRINANLAGGWRAGDVSQLVDHYRRKELTGDNQSRKAFSSAIRLQMLAELQLVLSELSVRGPWLCSMRQGSEGQGTACASLAGR